MDDSLVVPAVKRRRRVVAEKLAIVEQTLQPDASVARVAQQHRVVNDQVFDALSLFPNVVARRPRD